MFCVVLLIIGLLSGLIACYVWFWFGYDGGWLPGTGLFVVWLRFLAGFWCCITCALLLFISLSLWLLGLGFLCIGDCVIGSGLSMLRLWGCYCVWFGVLVVLWFGVAGVCCGVLRSEVC